MEEPRGILGQGTDCMMLSESIHVAARLSKPRGCAPRRLHPKVNDGRWMVVVHLRGLIRYGECATAVWGVVSEGTCTGVHEQRVHGTLLYLLPNCAVNLNLP